MLGNKAGSPMDTTEKNEVTDAMKQEEERVVEESAHAMEAMAASAQTEFDALVEKQKVARLHHLLEKSSKYTDFLYERMRNQQELAKGLHKKKASGAPSGLAEDDEPSSKGRKRSSSIKSPSKRAKCSAVAASRAPTDMAIEEELAAPQLQPPALFTGSLRDYQLTGMEWLKALFENGLNGILADEMGLGKTVQCIAFLCHLYGMGVSGPYLVVGPLSTLSNWMRELERFAPHLPALLYHGTPEERAMKRDTIMRPDPKLKACKVVVTSFEIVMRDRRFLANLPWKYIIVDEGHRLKNLNCRLIKELKTYQSANRLLLTGTPLQNDLSELWSLLNFLLPDIFDDLDNFQKWFDFSEDITSENANARILAKENEQQVLAKLHHILQPFLLRRLKQKAMYTSVLNKTIVEELAERNGTQKAGKITTFFRPRTTAAERAQTAPAIKKQAMSQVNVSGHNILMQLRKVCNHPYLVNWPLDYTGALTVDKTLISASGKMLLLDRVLPRLLQEGHKVLIFSQMTSMLDIIEDYLHLRNVDCFRLDGTVAFQERESQIKAFNEEGDVNIFLLSTRAGGLGINLMAADTVIIYDSDWNPQADLQAQDRCHRIGQKKVVMVYRFCTANSVEQLILERAESKRKLEKLVIHKGKFKGKGKEQLDALGSDELRELLMADTAESISFAPGEAVISDEDLARVLDRNAHVETFARAAPARLVRELEASAELF